MTGTYLRLLVVLLAFSHLLCLNAVPITRTRNLLNEFDQDHEILENTHKGNAERRWEVKNIVMRRMDVELNDYPGSGANNRHTPHPQPGS